jgi:hypothetical protein
MSLSCIMAMSLRRASPARYSAHLSDLLARRVTAAFDQFFLFGFFRCNYVCFPPEIDCARPPDSSLSGDSSHSLYARTLTYRYAFQLTQGVISYGSIQHDV